MNIKSKLFLEHLSKLKTNENAIFIETVETAFLAFIESLNNILEADEIISDDELIKMSDDEVEEKVKKLKEELKKFARFVPKKDIDSYEKLIEKRFVVDRKKLLYGSK